MAALKIAETDVVEKDGTLTPSEESLSTSVADWTQEEERRLVRRLDLLIMPLLIAGFFVLQLDRGNIGNALTDFFFRDVGITQNQFNIGQQLLSVGIVLLEIPSNYILYRIGPSIWISGQILAWGFVATFQAFQKGLGAFLATRLLLGLCESGFIPAGLFTITRYYKRDEISKRFAFFFLGNMVAQAVSSLIAYGILHMRGIADLAGWQWLFLLEGLLTILVGIVFTLVFPRSTTNPMCLLGIRHFSERETHIITQRVLLDDPTKAETRSSITWAEIKNVLTNWRLIPHVLLTTCGLAPVSTLWSYAPSLVNSFGYERLQSNAMTSIGQWIALFMNLLWGYSADKVGQRGPFVLLGTFLWWLMVLVCRLIIDSKNNRARFAVLTLAGGFGALFHPVNGSWMALNARTSGERSITMAVFIMAANCSGIVGSQIFQQQDRPLYRTGWTIMVSLLSLALVMATLANVQYRLLNRRLRQRGQLTEVTKYHY